MGQLTLRLRFSELGRWPCRRITSLAFLCGRNGWLGSEGAAMEKFSRQQIAQAWRSLPVLDVARVA